MRNDPVTVTPCYTSSEELELPQSTYLLSGGSCLVIVDPGPDWHLRHHMDEIAGIRDYMAEAIDGEVPMVVLVLSPGPGAFEGLPLIAGFSKRRSIVLHWKAAMGAAKALDGWRVQTLTTKGAGFPLAPALKLKIGISPQAGPPGSLMAYEPSSRTLFSGPFFGSIGRGRLTDESVLRRESVRAYTDIMSPGVRPDVVARVFAGPLDVIRIAPGHGHLAEGGNALIQTVFDQAGDGAPVQRALYRLFLRIAAMIGTDTAGGIYRATGVPVPELESGYRTLKGGEVAGLADDHWTRVLTSVEKWIPPSAQTAVFHEAARLGGIHDLPLTPTIERFGDAVLPPTLERTTAEKAANAPTPPELPVTGRLPATAESAAESATEQTAHQASSDLTDSTTGLMNETVFKQRLAGQLGETDATGGNGALIVIGVDDIQRINDNLGRTGGDDALYTVAYLLRNFQAAHSRKGAHRLYKLNGPHFAYVLSDGSVAEAGDIAERIRRLVSESAMFLEQLTVSIGVVGFEEAWDSNSDGAEPGAAGTGEAAVDTEALAEDATSRAFGRLRIARRGGANTVCSADPQQAGGLGSGATVVVADPDAPYLQMLTRQLEDQGYTVLLARDGAEASAIIEQIVPDAIVAEVMLPKQNGFALREELRHNATLNQIPFVLVSHRKNDEIVKKASMLGIVHFLAKPFSLVELIGLLRNLTRDSAAEVTRKPRQS